MQPRDLEHELPTPEHGWGDSPSRQAQRASMPVLLKEAVVMRNTVSAEVQKASPAAQLFAERLRPALRKQPVLSCRINPSHCILASFCAFTWEQPFCNDLSKISISYGIKTETRPRAAVGKEIGKVKSNLSLRVWFLELVSTVRSLKRGADFTKIFQYCYITKF